MGNFCSHLLWHLWGWGLEAFQLPFSAGGMCSHSVCFTMLHSFGLWTHLSKSFILISQSEVTESYKKYKLESYNYMKVFPPLQIFKGDFSPLPSRDQIKEADIADYASHSGFFLVNFCMKDVMLQGSQFHSGVLGPPLHFMQVPNSLPFQWSCWNPSLLVGRKIATSTLVLCRSEHSPVLFFNFLSSPFFSPPPFHLFKFLLFFCKVIHQFIRIFSHSSSIVAF